MEGHRKRPLLPQQSTAPEQHGSLTVQWGVPAGALACLFWVVYVTVATAGRTWPWYATRQHVVSFAGATLVLLCWLGAAAWVRRLVTGESWTSAAAKTLACCLPQALCGPVLLVVYLSDPVHHSFVTFAGVRLGIAAATMLLAVWLQVRGLLHDAPETAPRTVLPAIPLACACFVFYVFTSGAHMYIIDEVENYSVTKNLAEHLSLRGGIQGQDYSKYGVVMPLVAAALYRLERALGFPLPPGDGAIHWTWITREAAPYYPLTLLLFNPAATAATVGLVYAFARRLGGAHREALAVAVLYGVGTIAWVYTKTFYNLPLGVLLLTAAAYAALFNDHASPRRGLVAGLLFGTAAATRYEYLVWAPLVAGASAWVGGGVPADRFGRVRVLGLFVAGAAAAFMALALVPNTIKYGSPLNFGYSDQQKLTTYLDFDRAENGLLGLLISPSFGLLPSFPLAALVPVGLWQMRRLHARGAVFLAASILLGCVLYGRFPDWYGGRDYGPRYLLTILPFLASALLPIVRAALRSRLWLTVVVVPAAWGVAYAALGVVLSYDLAYMRIFYEMGPHPMSVGDQQIKWSIEASLPLSSLLLFLRWLQHGDFFYTPLGIPQQGIPGAGGLDFYLWQLHRDVPLRALLLAATILFVTLFAWLAVRPPAAWRRKA